jgi:hypothetical protein
VKKQSEVECVSVKHTKRASAFLMGAALVLCLATANHAAAQAGPKTVYLGSAAPFAVLGGQSVTSTGATIINGDLGVYPGTSFTPGTPAATVNGTIHLADPVAQHAQGSLTIAYNDAAGRTTAPITLNTAELGGRTLAPGLYKCTASATSLNGTLHLNGSGVYIFQIAAGLTVASGAAVVLSGGATSANIFWQVGSSATLGTTADFKGTILALTTITLATGAKLDGRALAQNGSVTLQDNAVTLPLGNTLLIQLPPPPDRNRD